MLEVSVKSTIEAGKASRSGPTMQPRPTRSLCDPIDLSCYTAREICSMECSTFLTGHASTSFIHFIAACIDIPEHTAVCDSLVST